MAGRRDQTRNHKVKDAVNWNGDTPVYPDDRLTPKYTVSVGDDGGCSG